ncbi:MAG TPA: DUF2652 domain-containing protein, partial [Puia sp.]|nr:DUF2652 domain-containing protein [Puia sp.]
VDGLLFIPDISGFTELVQSTDVLTGRYITSELLTAVVNQNELSLKIAEVEGDAILFYRHGNAPSLRELMQQYEMMIKAFENRRKELEETLSLTLDISLKIISHYGSMAEYKIGHFNKLYGEVVIEAHRLLKNSIGHNSYLLMTDALLAQAGTITENEPLRSGIKSNKLCEVYGTLKNICFTYFDSEKENLLKLVA